MTTRCDRTWQTTITSFPPVIKTDFVPFQINHTFVLQIHMKNNINNIYIVCVLGFMPTMMFSSMVNFTSVNSPITINLRAEVGKWVNASKPVDFKVCFTFKKIFNHDLKEWKLIFKVDV